MVPCQTDHVSIKGTVQAAALRQSFFISADRAAFLFLTAMQGVGFFPFLPSEVQRFVSVNPV
jgi:hypothetical protein